MLTDQLIRRGVHQSVVALENDVRRWITNWNQDPKPTVWTKTAEDIVQGVSRVPARSRRRTSASAWHRRRAELREDRRVSGTQNAGCEYA
jgi:hypothetical protein